QAEEKSSTVVEKASSAAQSVKESVQEAGHQMQAKGQAAVDAVKNATGINK
ncbi:pollen coat-like protein, partial [Genlisea aurea]